MKKYFFFLLMLALFSCSKFNRVQKRGTTEQKYQAAVKYFEKKDYYRASTLFEDIIPLLKGTEQSEKAEYYYAYSQYYQGNLILAAAYFRRFSEKFPKSEYREDAMYMNARSLFEDIPRYSLDQTNAYDATKGIQNFLNTYPKTQHLEDCNFMLDNISAKLEKKTYYLSKAYYRQRHYKAAVLALTNFRKEFPKSDYTEEIAYMVLDSKYHYARNSYEEKQKERYQAAIESYQSFVDEFPSGKYLKKAEETYALTIEKLDKLNLMLAKK
ncbi:MAG: outer membrane protein assembly factor BamD [Opitutaceae bacterium]|nr:outer membrane protein assembly factor BamD [Cytophagales bacterium]